jgi:uncharacterized membrane protein YhhN
MAIATAEEKTSTSATLNILFVVTALAAILSRVLGTDWRWLHYASKPLAIALLLVLVWRTLPPVSARYKWTIITGLIFALCGDTFLMLPQNYFIAGLICFLITHCFYLWGLISDVRFGARPLTFIICIVLAVCMVWGLWATLAPGLKLPVAVYALMLSLMAAQAIARAQVLSTGHARLAAIGALFFMASDSILAYGKFRFDIPLEGLWILTTYFAAQWFIAKSVALTRT